MPPKIEPLRFSHQAMATTFEVLVLDSRDTYCRQATCEAFGLLDRLEAQLSRFVQNSDISRINSSVPGRPVCVGLEAFTCIGLAARAWQVSKGCFDITKAGLMEMLQLDGTTMSVTRLSGQVQIDLGGIGKGFALDQMAQVLGQWRIDRALLHAGASTVLALDGDWPLSMSCPIHQRQLACLPISCRALSCSSQSRRPHVVDPRSGRYADGVTSAWFLARQAAIADALSTALLVGGPQVACEIVASAGGAAFLIVPAGGGCQGIVIGDWPEGGPRVCSCKTV